MNRNQVLAAVEQMRKMVEERGKWSTEYGHMDIHPHCYSTAARDRSIYIADLLQHTLFMLDEILKFLEAGRTDKVDRWLGFVQGILWSEGIASIDDFRLMNASAG